MAKVLYEIVMFDNGELSKVTSILKREVEYVDSAANKYSLLEFIRDTWEDWNCAIRSNGYLDRAAVRVTTDFEGYGRLGGWVFIPEEYYTLPAKGANLGMFNSVLAKMSGLNDTPIKKPLVDDNTALDLKISNIIMLIDGIVNNKNIFEYIASMVSNGYFDYRQLTNNSKATNVTEAYFRKLEEEGIKWSPEYKMSKWVIGVTFDGWVNYCSLNRLNGVVRFFAHEYDKISLPTFCRVLFSSLGTEDFAYGCSQLRVEDIKSMYVNKYVSQELLDNILLNVRTEVIQSLVLLDLNYSTNVKVRERYEHQRNLINKTMKG